MNQRTKSENCSEIGFKHIDFKISVFTLDPPPPKKKATAAAKLRKNNRR